MNNPFTSESNLMAPAYLSRTYQTDCVLTEVNRREYTEFHATLRPRVSETLPAFIRRFAELMYRHDAEPVRATLIASVEMYRQHEEIVRNTLAPFGCPVVWVEGGDCTECCVSGMHVHAVKGIPVETIEWEGRPVGRMLEDSDARYLWLGDIHSADAEKSRPQQALDTFEMMERIMSLAGMDMRNLVRTWLFIDRILDWYGDFNRVRNEFFKKHSLFDYLVPASTGISGAVPSGTAITAAAMAMEKKSDTAAVESVISPLQCPAPKYGSAFSRAVEVTTPDMRRLLVSGTASIAPSGESVHFDDPIAQIELTMQVVQAILQSRGMDYCDATRATAYVKHRDYAPLFWDYCHRRGLEEMPAVVTVCDVCRDELLFELEMDSIVPNE